MLKAALKPKYLSEYKYNLVFVKYSLLLVIVLCCSSYEVLAQVLNTTIIDKNTIAQPLTVKGISGGAIAIEEIAQTEATATGYCDGYIQPQPNHLLKLESFFEFLRLEVQSPVDTTILVKGPGGVWCNDDAGTANPMIEGQWQPGVYKIWIGSYQGNIRNDYQIQITGK